jgi:hypothetical protein
MLSTVKTESALNDRSVEFCSEMFTVTGNFQGFSSEE